MIWMEILYKNGHPLPLLEEHFVLKKEQFLFALIKTILNINQQVDINEQMYTNPILQNMKIIVKMQK